MVFLKNIQNYTLLVTLLFLVGISNNVLAAKKKSLISIETDYTISKVGIAKDKETNIIVASSYEGTVLGVSYSGKILWENKLSGFMNHDLWCGDVTNDGIDEVLVANANGSIYCLTSKGKLLWSFKENDVPMYGVSVINSQKEAYVVCSGFDKNIYYLDKKGKKVKTISAVTYSQEKPWSWMEVNPKGKNHTVNFIRPVKKKDGTELLAVVGQIAQGTSGSIYLFNPLEDKPYKRIKIKAKKSIGSFKTIDTNNDGDEEIIMGTTGMLADSYVVNINPHTFEQSVMTLANNRKNIDGFGYRIVEPEVISDGNGGFEYYIMFGSRTLLLKPGKDPKDAEVLICKYSFNDIEKDPINNRIILASAQSGGSCIHILNTNNSNWKEEYTSLKPPGKIQTILDNTKIVNKQLKTFKKPDNEREVLPVYFMSDKFSTPYTKKIGKQLIDNYESPIFLGGKHQRFVEKFDRSFMNNVKYEKRRDRRKKYVLSQEQVVNALSPLYKEVKGIAYWGGHGNDPNYYQVSTTKKILDAANGKKTVIIFPEIQDPTENFTWLMNYLMYPLADSCQERNGNLYIRSKYNFWQGDVYLPGWSKLISGEYKDIFVPALEETSCKAMDQSIAARLGIWSSGAVDSWGARCARDNTSFDRSRENSHQMLPNHFLRQMVYNVSLGAQYLDNFPVDQNYMSLLWELIAKGALYVPKRNELLNLNPVHLSMKDPNEHYLTEGANVHWTVFYDKKNEEQNKMVFSRMNGSWKGAPVTPWDFSNYASGVKERRLEFLPTYPNGIVMITPPQHGVFADKNVPRGKMIDKLHPLYKGIMKEYITDGKDYYSSDGTEKYNPDNYYKNIKESIKKASKKIPITVNGKVAWVVAQSSAKHLRLTLVDGGYINPDDRIAKIKFNNIEVKSITDLLSREKFKADDSGNLEIHIACGMFRFLDVELKKTL